VVERTLAWITRHWRTVRDYERLPAHDETYIWSMIIVMTPPPRPHTRPGQDPSPAAAHLSPGGYPRGAVSV
jgi:hypothetical protein